MPVRVDPTKASEFSSSLLSELYDQIIGQRAAINNVVKVLEKFYIGLNPANRPIASFLFLGATGVGKSELVHALAHALLGNRNALTRLDCGEYQHSHEISKLIGAPPGYLGHRDTQARISQKQLDKFQRPDHRDPNILLLDEIEKAHDDMHRMFLGGLDCGRVTLGDASEVDLSETIIIMTSNLGSKEVARFLGHTGLGFHTNSQEKQQTDKKIEELSLAAAKKFFSSEFRNRLDSVIVFQSLSEENLKEILRIEMRKFRERIGEEPHLISFRVTAKVENFLIGKGYSAEFGAREIRRTVEKYLVDPFVSLIASRQIQSGDMVTVGLAEGGETLTFDRTEDALVVRKK